MTQKKHDVLVGEHQTAVQLLLLSLAPSVQANFKFVHNRAGLRNKLPLQSPDLLLLDKNIPPVNGLVCLNEIPKAILAKTVVLDSTSTTTLNSPLIQQTFGVSSCLGFPLSPRELIAQFNTVLNNKPNGQIVPSYTERAQLDGCKFASLLAASFFFQFSGIVRISGDGQLAHIHFVQGLPCYVAHSRVGDRFITPDLFRKKLVTVDAQTLIDVAKPEFEQFRALLDNDWIDDEPFFEALEDFIFDELAAIASWRNTEAQLAYRESSFDEPPFEINLIDLVRKITWQTYTLSTLRMEYPDVSVRHRRIDNPYLPIDNFEDDRVILQFYNLLNGLTDLQTILASRMYTELEAYRMVFLLEQFRLVERVNPQDQPTTQRMYESVAEDANRTIQMDMNTVFQFLDEHNAKAMELDANGEANEEVPFGDDDLPFQDSSPGVVSSLTQNSFTSASPENQRPKRADQTIQIAEFALTKFGDFDRLGDYLLLRPLAAGGMGEIHLGCHLTSKGVESFVAVKKLLAELCEDESLITMFRDEARVVSQLKHPNIVQFRDFIRQDDIYYIVMDYIPGRNMREMIRAVKKNRRPLPLDASLYIISEICTGLHYAHTGTNQRGEDLQLIHRDINPQNVLLSFEGDVKIIDFGIAKTAIQRTVTLVGQIKGKYSYMSPEQVLGQKLDHRSDIFSLGLVLYQLVTGRKTFRIRSEVDLLTAIVECDFKRPRELNPRLPEELEAIVLKCLARDRNDRYPTTLALRDAIKRFGNRFKLNLNQDFLRTFLQDIFVDDHRAEMDRLQKYRAAVFLSPEFGKAAAQPTETTESLLEELPATIAGPTSENSYPTLPRNGTPATKMQSGPQTPISGSMVAPQSLRYSSNPKIIPGVDAMRGGRGSSNLDEPEPIVVLKHPRKKKRSKTPWVVMLVLLVLGGLTVAALYFLEII